MAIGSFIQSNTQEGAFTAVNSSAATMVDKEGYFVTPTGNMVTLEAQSGGKYLEMKVCTEVTDDPIYLLQAGAAASKPIEVLPLSPHRNLRCVAGGAITANELLTVHSDGTAVSAVNGSTIIGYAEEDAAAGGYVKFRPASPGMVHSTATAWYDGAATTLADDHTFVTGTTKGLKIGGAANQKVGFYGVAPVVQGTNTADIKDTLVALGFFADGTHATPLNLDGGALTTTGAASLTGGVTVDNTLTLTDTAAAGVIDVGATNGAQIGTTGDKLGFFGLATPIVQPTSANQTKVTDNSGGAVTDATAVAVTTNAATTDNSTGTAGNTVAAGAGVHTITIPIELSTVIDGDVLTTYTPGYKFKILGVAFATTAVATTPAKATTLNLEIGTTNLTGGAVALTSANQATLGVVTAGTAVTGNNTGSASDTISVEGSSTTAFAEGAGLLLIKIQNMDTADAIASFAAKLNTISTAITNLNNNYAKTTELTNAVRDGVVALGLIKGS